MVRATQVVSELLVNVPLAGAKVVSGERVALSVVKLSLGLSNNAMLHPRLSVFPSPVALIEMLFWHANATLVP